MRTGNHLRAFTLIELLVVISIIGMLAAVVLAGTASARDKAKIAKAKSELIQIRNAIVLMASDTGLWPNGCQIGQIIQPPEASGSSNEIDLNDRQSGLAQQPPLANTGGSPPLCVWTPQAAAAWKGPYISVSPLVDPWGTDYWFDNDYEAYRDCLSNPKPGVLAVIVSAGPDKLGPNYNGLQPGGYGCDDIFVQLY
jgi:prepilin-type N-terminal cleavage/methylation domain-containing protein